MKLTIPELSLVLLIGPSGAGKSTFGRKHFKPTEVISSDFCRGLVSDDENSREATGDAFELLRVIAAKRLAAGRLTVIDATNVQPESRKPLIALAREFHCLPVAVVLDVPEKVCQERNRARADRTFGGHVIHNQLHQMHRSLRGLEKEGFRHVHHLTPETIEQTQIERQPLWNNRRHEHGPFDIIGDIHGCLAELETLLERLGYAAPSYAHPAGRRAVFLGDLVDRGPGVVGVLKRVMQMVASGAALCVPGNHELKLMRKLRGKNVKMTHGIAESMAQLELEPPEFRTQVVEFIDGLVSHYVFDDGKLVVAHAGLKESMQGRGSGAVRSFAMFGETTGETDDYGLPVRFNWAAEYRGKAAMVYGHTPVLEAQWLNNTICIDTGCVYGGSLTSLRYPERELVSVKAERVYCESAKPLGAVGGLSDQQQHDDVLDLDDVVGKRIISTRLLQQITVREENATAALEVMSRFAANPKWLIYLPPTMSPAATTKQPGLLEHPAEAFAYYADAGVASVICEEKHMGSRAVVVICKSAAAARARFGIAGDALGICYTRTGRRFFNDAALEAEFLERVRSSVERAGLWDELKTDWLCLDCELMPWSMKAQELVRDQYAALGSSGKQALAVSVRSLEQASQRGLAVDALLAKTTARAGHVEKFIEAYRHYCWPVGSIADLRLAPFHVLASEGACHADKDHAWHLQMIARLCAPSEGLIIATRHRQVDLTQEASRAEGVAWWEALTGAGGEGMVVKPSTFLARGKRGILQPAMKCRGPEYLRIIYGPEYLLEENLSRLRSRGLSVKRAIALREFSLGIEGLERFVARKPLRSVHECVFGVLAMESEPVDPRL